MNLLNTGREGADISIGFEDLVSELDCLLGRGQVQKNSIDLVLDADLKIKAFLEYISMSDSY